MDQTQVDMFNIKIQRRNNNNKTGNQPVIKWIQFVCIYITRLHTRKNKYHFTMDDERERERCINNFLFKFPHKE